MELLRQEYWSGLPFPLPRDLPHLGIEPVSPALQEDSLPSEPPCSEAQIGSEDPSQIWFVNSMNIS